MQYVERSNKSTPFASKLYKLYCIEEKYLSRNRITSQTIEDEENVRYFRLV